MNIKVLYRISTNGYVKPKFDYATKMNCLMNAVQHFGADTIHLFVDRVNLTLDLSTYTPGFAHQEEYTAGSSAGSFRYVYEYSLNQWWPADTIVYYLEDDYLHRPGSAQVLREGVARANYVSLYDHNDKYIPGTQGGNPFIGEDGGEVTKVFRTDSTHWKLTNSTTMTFATTIEQLTIDKNILDRYIQGTHPNDFQMFLDLHDAGRSLITPIPGYSTHCEPRWAAPGIDWSTMV
jgi:hypothetical protein